MSAIAIDEVSILEFNFGLEVQTGSGKLLKSVDTSVDIFILMEYS